jgi:hypothetical protein
MIITLAVYSICAVSRRTARVSLCVIAAFTLLYSAEWHITPAPENIIAVDTSFGRLGSGSFNFEQDYERAKMVFGDLKKRDIGESEARVIVLPETIAGRLNKTGLELWKDEIQRLLPDKAVIFGAELPTGDGMKYDNAILMGISRKWSTRPRETVHSAAKNGPPLRGGGPLAGIDKHTRYGTDQNNHGPSSDQVTFSAPCVYASNPCRQ